MKRLLPNGVTLLELLVVVLIIGILSSVAVVVYTGQLERARIAAAQDNIRQFEMAATVYEVDTGELPLSYTGTTLPPSSPMDPGYIAQGCGYLYVALVHSLSGSMTSPLSNYWHGPYLTLDEEQLGTLNGNPITSGTPLPSIQILDPWGTPYCYVRWSEYATWGATENPTVATETYYNPLTMQIFSKGPNRRTSTSRQDWGREADDINNW